MHELNAKPLELLLVLLRNPKPTATSLSMANAKFQAKPPKMPVSTWAETVHHCIINGL